VLPGIIGTIQATEALKLVLRVGEPLIGRFLMFDALKMRFREIKLARDPDCPICGTNPTIHELFDYDEYCTSSTPAQKRPTDVTVRELKELMDAGRAPAILDVREPFEAELCSIPGATLIPLGELPRRLDELPGDADLVVLCKSGSRSARAVSILREKGFKQARNLAGGILAWIDEVDSSLTRY